MHQLTKLLQLATARVPHLYFQVELDGGDPVYRERVYCYELYHQLRCHWPNQKGQTRLKIGDRRLNTQSIESDPFGPFTNDLA